MRLPGFLRSPLTLPLAAAIVIASYLAVNNASAKRADPDDGIVWVYYTSLCAKPGDSSDCKLTRQAVRPAFANLGACSAFRDADLGHHGNPRLMGSCLKQREA